MIVKATFRDDGQNPGIRVKVGCKKEQYLTYSTRKILEAFFDRSPLNGRALNVSEVRPSEGTRYLSIPTWPRICPAGVARIFGEPDGVPVTRLYFWEWKA